jgi:hypothetical protein
MDSVAFKAKVERVIERLGHWILLVLCLVKNLKGHASCLTVAPTWRFRRFGEKKKKKKNPSLLNQVPKKDVPHVYGDKYKLAEMLSNVTYGSVVNVLEVLGLNAKTLRQVKKWQLEGRSVTLRFKSEDRCDFDRETKREEVESFLLNGSFFVSPSFIRWETRNMSENILEEARLLTRSSRQSQSKCVLLKIPFKDWVKDGFGGLNGIMR